MPTPKFKWTEGVILDALREEYLPASNPLSTEEWAFLTQVPLRTVKNGYAHLAESEHRLHSGYLNERTIDALLVRNWAGGKYGHERLAIEVKVSRADYRNETPEKRAPAEASAHRCAYAAPAGLLDPADLPTDWGLIEVHAPSDEHPRLEVKWRKRAARRTPTADLNYLVAAGFRRASRAEERIRRGDGAAAELASLRAEVVSLRAVAERAIQARDREIERAKAARSELLSLAGAQECADCGGSLTWKRGGHYDMRWQHVDRAAEDACHNERWSRYLEARQRGEGSAVPFRQDPRPVAAVELDEEIL